MWAGQQQKPPAAKASPTRAEVPQESGGVEQLAVQLLIIKNNYFRGLQRAEVSICTAGIWSKDYLQYIHSRKYVNVLKEQNIGTHCLGDYVYYNFKHYYGSIVFLYKFRNSPAYVKSYFLILLRKEEIN